jgi:hypothetical protein
MTTSTIPHPLATLSQRIHRDGASRVEQRCRSPRTRHPASRSDARMRRSTHPWRERAGDRCLDESESTTAMVSSTGLIEPQLSLKPTRRVPPKQAYQYFEPPPTRRSPAPEGREGIGR